MLAELTTLAINEAYFGKVDALERKMAELPQQECPVKHHFTPGLYAREIFMPAGTVVTSKIHKTEHPFVVSKGKVLVHDNETANEITAPYFGVTKAGTRRVLYVVEDCVWITFHPTSETDVAKIEQQIILKHDDHLCLGPH